MKKGKLIVFEGADGSGKTTQSKLLLKYLKGRKIACEYVSFPRYEDSLWGGMVRRFLRGEFGKLNEIDPYLASILYAGDRMTAAPMLRRWLDSGKIVIANRYIGSNIGHMGAKLKTQNSKLKYIKWLEQLEYVENGIPKEDLVIFLYVPIAVSKNLMKGRTLDIHERDFDYQERVLSVYGDLCRKKKNWLKVDCTWRGKILKPEEIHKKVLEDLETRMILARRK